MSPASIAQAADENLATHFTWVQARTAGMRAMIREDLVVTDCGLPCDTFNAVCRARLSPSEAPRRVREAIIGFEERPFSWWLSPADTPADLGQLLEAAGLAPSETEVAMAVSLSRLRVGEPPPADIVIRRARSKAELSDFARVNAANWSPPDPYVQRFYELAAPVLLAPDCPIRLYVGYFDGEAVAAAELTDAGGVAGVYGVSTLSKHRQRGYGTAMTLRPLLDAREAGRGIAVLQASAAGAGLYERIGFEGFGRITEYKPRGGER